MNRKLTNQNDELGEREERERSEKGVAGILLLLFKTSDATTHCFLVYFRADIG